MNREDFAILFDKLRTLHEQASSVALARDPEWEISNPMFVLGVKIDDDEPEIVPAPLPPVSPERLGELARFLLARILEGGPEMLVPVLRNVSTGEHPTRVELLAAGFCSEGWSKDADTGERLEELSFVVLEDRDYHVGCASYTKDVKNARLVLKDTSVTTVTHDVESNMGNLFNLEPREHAH